MPLFLRSASHLETWFRREPQSVNLRADLAETRGWQAIAEANLARRGPQRGRTKQLAAARERLLEGQAEFEAIKRGGVIPAENSDMPQTIHAELGRLDVELGGDDEMLHIRGGHDGLVNEVGDEGLQLRPEC